MNITEHLKLHEKLWTTVIIFLSVAVVGLVGLLLFQTQAADTTPDERIYILPQLNAIINSFVTLLLISGFIAIRQANIQVHKLCMLGAFCLSILFLLSYVTYHHMAPSTSFGGEGLVRYFYFTILVSHIILAIFIVPMALFTLLRAFQNKLDKHKKIARWTLPIWLYVGITGVIIYLMISPYYPV